MITKSSEVVHKTVKGRPKFQVQSEIVPIHHIRVKQYLQSNATLQAISHDMTTMQIYRYPRIFPDVPLASAITQAFPYAYTNAASWAFQMPLPHHSTVAACSLLSISDNAVQMPG